MHLGVNAVRFSRPFTGVGRYLECVLDEWSRMALPFDRITLYTHTPIAPGAVCFPLQRFGVEVIGRRLPDPLWEWRWLGPRAREVDVLYCPSYTIPFGYAGRCAVMNLGPAENRPGSYQWWRAQAYERLYRYSARRADEVFACSRSVKQRLVSVYGIPAPKVHVTYLAASRAFRPLRDPALLDEVRRRHAGGRPFVLFVGKMAARHYIPNLLEAFAALTRTTAVPHELVLVGPDYLHLDIPARARRLGIGDRVVHVPFVPHLELPPLYNAADAFVFPASEAEGFGIPVIEAMACGTPVVTVNQGSLREFAPGAAHLVASSAASELSEGLRAVLADASLRERLAAAGLERAATITWRYTAEKTMDVLWRLATA